MKFNLYNLYKNKTDSWSTPKNIYDFFINNGYKDFNPLNDDYSNSFLLKHDDYFCNPPFSNIQPFVDYMIKNHKLGFKTTLLLPIRLNTLYFKQIISYGADICIVGRLNYSGKGCAPFDSCLVMLNGSGSCKIFWNKHFKEKFNNWFVQLSIFDDIDNLEDYKEIQEIKEYFDI